MIRTKLSCCSVAWGHTAIVEIEEEIKKANKKSKKSYKKVKENEIKEENKTAGKLRKVHRLALCQLSLMRVNTPTRSLEVIAGIPSSHLKIEEIPLTSAARLLLCKLKHPFMILGY